MSIKDTFEKVGDKVSQFEADDILKALGLQKRRSGAEKAAPTLAAFGVGLVVGAAIALVVSPKNGGEIRQALADAIGGLLGNAKKMMGIEDKAAATPEKAEKAEAPARATTRPEAVGRAGGNSASRAHGQTASSRGPTEGSES